VFADPFDTERRYRIEDNFQIQNYNKAISEGRENEKI
jgi:hypothetical protein